MWNKKTTEQFIEDANKKHNNIYNYDNVVYTKNSVKVKIMCKKHGDFEQIPANHLNGQGCPKCGIESRSKKATKTTEQFIKEAKEVHGDRYDYSKVEYKNCFEKVVIICNTHGDFLQTPDRHLAGAGCKSCGIESSNNYKKCTNESFLKKAKKVHGDKFDYSKVEYTSFNSEVVIVCKTHGEYKQTPYNHLQIGCILCNKSNKHEDKKQTAEDIIKKASEKYKNTYDFSEAEFINNTTKIKIICKEHGEFYKFIRDIDKNIKCPTCYKKSANNDKRMTLEDFKKVSNEVHNYKYNYDKVEYENCRKNNS